MDGWYFFKTRQKRDYLPLNRNEHGFRFTVSQFGSGGIYSNMLYKSLKHWDCGLVKKHATAIVTAKLLGSKIVDI